MPIDGNNRFRTALSPALTKVHIGEDDLSQWSDEELQRGKRRSADGRFHGPDPEVLPRAVVDELNRRAFHQANSIVRDDVEDAVRLWGQIVRDPDADLSLRLEASKEIANRILGKVSDRAQVEVAIHRQPWENAIIAGLVATEGDVIDVEVIDVGEDIEWNE